MPEILSQHSSSLVDNNTIDEANSSETRNSDKGYRDEDTDDKNEKDHPSYGHVDNSIKKFAPRFKHPSRMYAMEMKPAGNSIRLKCAAEGKYGNTFFPSNVSLWSELEIISCY